MKIDVLLRLCFTLIVSSWLRQFSIGRRRKRDWTCAWMRDIQHSVSDWQCIELFAVENSSITVTKATNSHCSSLLFAPFFSSRHQNREIKERKRGVSLLLATGAASWFISSVRIVDNKDKNTSDLLLLSAIFASDDSLPWRQDDVDLDGSTSTENNLHRSTWANGWWNHRSLPGRDERLQRKMKLYPPKDSWSTEISSFSRNSRRKNAYRSTVIGHINLAVNEDDTNRDWFRCSLPSRTLSRRNVQQ